MRGFLSGLKIKDEKRVNILYALLQCFYWGANCIYFSFLVLYLKENNYSDSIIGLIMMVLSVVSTVTPAILGYVADFYIPIKKIVSSFLLLAIPAAFLLKFTLFIVPLTFLSVFLIGIFEKSLVSVIDSWAVKIRQKKTYLNYGLTRGLAALVFASVALIFGRVFDAIGIETLFYVHALFAFIAALAAVYLDNIEIASLKHTDSQKKTYWSAIKILFRNQNYVLLVIAMFCSGVGLVSTFTFQPFLINEMGGTTTHLGISLFIMAVSEAPVLFNYNRISKRFSFKFLLWISFFFMIIRVFSYVLVPNLSWLIGIQIIQALSFALYLPSVLLYIAEITSSDMKSTAITFAIAFNDGVAGIVGNALGGYISEIYGVLAVFKLFSVIALLGFLVFTYSFIRKK